MALFTRFITAMAPPSHHSLPALIPPVTLRRSAALHHGQRSAYRAPGFPDDVNVPAAFRQSGCDVHPAVQARINVRHKGLLRLTAYGSDAPARRPFFPWQTNVHID